LGLNSSTHREDHTQCDNWQGSAFADDPSTRIPRNIRIESTNFLNNNTRAIGGKARYVGIRGNTFTNNYINPQVGNGGGGSLELEQCADQVQIMDI
jgi:hypothetical protein